MPERYQHPAEPIDIVCPKCGQHATFRLAPGDAPHPAAPRMRDDAWQAASPDWGLCQCDHCVARFDHALQWPHDAYWRTSVRGYDLWAHSRAEVAALIQFVGAKDRDLFHFPEHAYFLRRFPKPLLSAKKRDEVVKHLARLLEEKTALRTGFSKNA